LVFTCLLPDVLNDGGSDKINPLVQKSIERGTDFLRNNTETVELIVSNDEWASAILVNKAAKDLFDAIDDGTVGHSQRLLEESFKRVLAKAQSDFGYKVESEDKGNGERLVKITR